MTSLFDDLRRDLAGTGIKLVRLAGDEPEPQPTADEPPLDLRGKLGNHTRALAAPETRRMG